VAAIKEVSENPGIRKLGWISAISIVVANMIGTGIFTTTGFLAADLGAPVPILIGWMLGGIIALCGALTYSELAVNIPGNGGEYLYLSRLYHPALGFLSGWVSLFAGFSAPIAAASVAFGHYAHAIFPSADPVLSAVALLIAFTLLHIVNVQAGGTIQSIITIVKVLVIILLVVAALLIPDKPTFIQAGENDFQVVISPAFAVGLIFIMYSYSGWNAAAYIAGEVKNPERNLPISLVGGTLIVIILYLMLNIFYLSFVPLDAIAGKVEVAHIVANSLLGDAGSNIVSLLITLALITSVSAMTMAGARVYQVMGKDHLFFSWLSRKSNWGSPVNAILLQSLISLALILTMAFHAILFYVGFTLSLFAGLTVFSVFILRRRTTERKGYRTWGYPITPLIFLIVTAWMVIYVFLNQTQESLIGLGTLAAGIVFYYLLARRGGSAS
jgi:APA family basic amino acid/polyamine antiporter